MVDIFSVAMCSIAVAGIIYTIHDWSLQIKKKRQLKNNTWMTADFKLCVNSLKKSIVVYDMAKKPKWYFLDDVLFKSNHVSQDMAQAGLVEAISKMDDRSMLKITIKVEEIKDDSGTI